MKNTFRLLLLPLLLSLSLHAEELQPDGMQMPNMDMFNMESTNDDLVMRAYDVRRDLLCQPEVNKKTLQQVDAILEDLNSQDNPEVLLAYRHHLRRWEKLGKLSLKEPFDQKRHILLSKLIAHRESIVKKIMSCYIKMAFAQRTVADLPTILGHEPTLAEKELYQRELEVIDKKCVEQIKVYQKQLEPIERQLLGDNRNFIEKYGNLIGGGIVGVVGIAGLIYISNGIASWYNSDKKN